MEGADSAGCDFTKDPGGEWGLLDVGRLNLEAGLSVSFEISGIFNTHECALLEVFEVGRNPFKVTGLCTAMVPRIRGVVHQMEMRGLSTCGFK